MITTNIALKYQLIVGGLLEGLLFLVVYQSTPTIEEAFRLAARYSGRLSLLAFLIPWLFYIRTDISSDKGTVLFSFLRFFAVLHAIHFFFLAINIMLNDIPLIPVKLVGGMLAYISILLLPFFEKNIKLKQPILNVYFFYVGLVMIVTYVSRIKGDFEGSQPSIVHYIALFALLAIMTFFCVKGVTHYFQKGNKDS
ncbi:MAG: hypothetical protein ACON47_05895 [Flavobacteriaceae bacterium]